MCSIGEFTKELDKSAFNALTMLVAKQSIENGTISINLYDLVI